MKHICNYSILRFLPYPETGEFVNIGIVLLANNGEFRFKIATRRQRVTRFFETLDYRIYLRARHEIDTELHRLTGFFASRRNDLGQLVTTFRNLIQPRETMMRFSEPGTLTTDNIGEALDTLFEHYVNHSFASKEYQEKTLERQLGNLLATHLKQRYTERRLGDSEYDVRFPFVLMADDQAAQAIKPLYLGHDEPGRIYERGDAWKAKVTRLKRAQRLARDTLFITEPPAEDQPKQAKAYEEVTRELAEIEGVRVVSTKRPDRELLGEIKRGIPPTTH